MQRLPDPVGLDVLLHAVGGRMKQDGGEPPRWQVASTLVVPPEDARDLNALKVAEPVDVLC